MSCAPRHPVLQSNFSCYGLRHADRPEQTDLPRWLPPSLGELAVPEPVPHILSRHRQRLVGRMSRYAGPVRPKHEQRQRGLAVRDLAVDPVERPAVLARALDPGAHKVVEPKQPTDAPAFEQAAHEHAVWAGGRIGGAGPRVVVHDRAVMLDAVVQAEVVQVEREPPPTAADDEADGGEEDGKHPGEVVHVVLGAHELPPGDVSAVPWSGGVVRTEHAMKQERTYKYPWFDSALRAGQGDRLTFRVLTLM
jgi:hypothetical protein